MTPDILLPTTTSSMASPGPQHYLRGGRPRAVFVSLSTIALCLVLLGLVGRAEGLDCVQCDSNTTHRECIDEPPYALPCDENMVVCLTIREYFPADGPDKTLVSVVRTCSPKDMGWDCEKGTRYTGEMTEICHESCNWDACNVSSLFSPFVGMTIFALTVLFLMPQVLLS